MALPLFYACYLSGRCQRWSIGSQIKSLVKYYDFSGFIVSVIG